MQANTGTASRKAAIREKRHISNVAILTTATVVFLLVGIALHSNLEAKTRNHERGLEIIRRTVSASVYAAETGYKVVLAAAEAEVEKQKAAEAARIAQEQAAAVRKDQEDQEAADALYKNTLYAAKAEGEKPIGGGVPENPDPVQGKGTSVQFESTCYCLSGTTASGLPVGPGIIAVDPNEIPLGTRVYVSGYGYAIAADTGGAIKGKIIDVWLPTYNECMNWGRRMVTVTF